MSTNPTHIGTYEVVRLLGRGGMGAVYLARDPAIGRLVAIKLLREGVESDELRERFAREARAAGGLRHPNIVTIFQAGPHEVEPYLVMEYIPGDTLAQVVERRLPLTVPRKLRIMEEVCHGLAYAHRAGIVHRDVKPANILVDPDGIVKILDFGIARMGEQGLTRSGMVVGSLNYMAPEQIDPGTADHRSDVFAVGLVLYELLTYQKAFPGQDFSVFHRILHTEPSPIETLCDGVPPDLTDIVGRALKKNPEERYQDLAGMRAALSRVRMRLRRGHDDVSDEGPLVASSESALSRDADTATQPSAAPAIDALLADARQAFDGGRFTDAIAACDKVVALAPDHKGALDLRDASARAAALAQAQTLLGVAAAEWARGDESRVRDLLREADQVAAGLTIPAHLREQIATLKDEIAALDAARAEARQSVARGLAALASGALDQAVSAHEEAQRLAPADAGVVYLGREVAAAKAAAEEAERRRLAEEQARREAEEAAERARQEAEAEARRLAEEAAERARLEAEAEAKRRAAEKAAAEEAERRRVAEEQARQEAEAQARREAEEAAERARLEAEAEARRLAEEAAEEAAERARQEAEAEARRLAEEAAERARLEAEAEAKRRAAEEAERRLAEEQARREAEEAAERARQEAEAEARRLAEEAAERARLEAEAEAKRLAAEKAAEEKARRQAEARARREAEEQARREAEEAAERARQEAEAEARRLAEEAAERARLEAEAEAKRLAAEKAAAAEAERRRLAEEQARQKAEARARREAEEAAERARRDAEDRARRDAHAHAVRSALDIASSQASAGDYAGALAAVEALRFDDPLLESPPLTELERSARRLTKQWRAAQRTSAHTPAATRATDPADVTLVAPRSAIPAASPHVASAPPSAQPSPASRLRPAHWMTAAALLLVLALGVVWVGMSSGPDSSSQNSDTGADAATSDAPTPGGATSEPAPGDDPEADTAAADPPAAATEAAPDVTTPPAVRALHDRLLPAIRRGDVAAVLALIERAEPGVVQDPLVQADLDPIMATARRAALSARADADKANAPQLATAAYDTGVARHAAATNALRQGNTPRALQALLYATTAFNEAAEAGRAATLARQQTTPPEGVLQPPQPAEPVKTAGPTLPPPPTDVPPPQPVVREPAKGSPPVVTPAQPVDETPAIRAVLDQFVRGYETLDVELVRRVWPSAPANLSFDDVRSQSVTLQNVLISQTGDSATVTCTRQTTAQLTAGRPRSASQAVTFSMRRSAGGWIIASVSPGR